MGETGCGKTMLIEFMAKLQVPEELEDKLTKTMIKVNVRVVFLLPVYLCYKKISQPYTKTWQTIK